MNYQLNKWDTKEKKESFLDSAKRLGPLLSGEKRGLILTLIAVLFSSGSTLVAPIIIWRTIDTYMVARDFQGILMNSAILFAIYAIGSISSYLQTNFMGWVGRRTLFNLRNAIFNKIQELPVAFFNQNKAGDLISRINNDTDKLNQFFSQALMQFLGNFFLILGSGIFVLFLNFKLGAATLAPALGVFVVTQLVSGWVKSMSLKSLQSTGWMSAEIQESLDNFKVIVAFNRLDYFRRKFADFNQANYLASLKAGAASNIFIPLYGLASNLAQLIALAYGIYLISIGNITLGLLIGFQFYVNNFYSPLRQLASVWSSFQLALASLDRVSEVLALKSDMQTLDEPENQNSKIQNSEVWGNGSKAKNNGSKTQNEDSKVKKTVLEFRDVSFHYPNGTAVLKNISFTLERWKTYALVGPTGGGKTTTALLMARLYDPSSGTVWLDEKDIRAYEMSERTARIGFILQEPFLFSGTVRENILYGNDQFIEYSNEQITEFLERRGLADLLSKFEKGLDTKVSTSGDSVSLGQKQLLAFMRAILRSPEILILDEATANIDTVTEQILEQMLEKLPENTTKVIIAHRLNTIKNADEIFFVNSWEVTSTGNMEHALDMLLHGKRKS